MKNAQIIACRYGTASRPERAVWNNRIIHSQLDGLYAAKWHWEYWLEAGNKYLKIWWWHFREITVHMLGRQVSFTDIVTKASTLSTLKCFSLWTVFIVGLSLFQTFRLWPPSVLLAWNTEGLVLNVAEKDVTADKIYTQVLYLLACITPEHIRLPLHQPSPFIFLFSIYQKKFVNITRKQFR